MRVTVRENETRTGYLVREDNTDRILLDDVDESYARAFADFLDSYIETALWSDTDMSDESGGLSLNQDYDEDDIDDESYIAIAEECLDFFDENRETWLRGGWDDRSAGHDFCLTRNGHGSGFWDRNMEGGDKLTQASKPYGTSCLIVGELHKLFVTS